MLNVSYIRRKKILKNEKLNTAAGLKKRRSILSTVKRLFSSVFGTNILVFKKELSASCPVN